MLIIRGVNVFPSQVESVLMEMAETTPLPAHRTAEHNLDTLGYGGGGSAELVRQHP